MVAKALAHGSVRLAAYAPAQRDDAATRALMPRIDARVDPEIDTAFPGQRAARVTIETRSGARLVHLQPNRKGNPELPLSDAELGSKFAELSGPVLGSANVGALLAQLWALERAAVLPEPRPA